ncbi:MAG: FtsX-like permease family protein [Aggregatilineales bacterium]
MFQKFGFYIKHSLNDLRVNGQRTFFALLCIAAGVAAIVSLQTLAGMISNTLTDNLQRNNRGDIQFTTEGEFGGDEAIFQNAVDDGLLVEETFSGFGQSGSQYYVSEAGLQAVRDWLNGRYGDQVELTYRQPLASQIEVIFGSGAGTAITDPVSGVDASQLSPILIDSAVYPYYNSIETQAGTPLSEALSSPESIVLSDKVTEQLDLAVGDSVRISGSDASFIVTGIVNTDVEVTNPLEGFFNSQFGFYYLDVSAVSLFTDVTPRANTIFLRIENATPELVNEINSGLQENFPFVQTTTTEDLRENYTQLSDAISDLVTVMGLVSMLIGSIGIINTMQVIVRRRTVEVAVLKTIGLQANQVTTLFLVEAVIMGVIGSIAGVALGWIATFAIKGVAESIFTTDIPFVIVPGAVVNGLVVGILVTTIFGFLPTLTAGQVRPGIVLRPTDNIVPRAGILRSLFAILVIMLVLIGLAYTITGNFGISAAAVIGSFFAVAILYGLLNLMIWIVGRFFPSFGSVDLKISLRQMAAGRARAAVTLLALVIGVFSLSLITLFAQSINNLLSTTLEDAAGGNLAISLESPDNLETVINLIDAQEGVNGYNINRSYSVQFVELVEGDTGDVVSLAQIGDRINNAETPFGGTFGDDEDPDASQELFAQTVGTIDARTMDDLPDRTFREGRGLTAGDEGQPVAVMTGSFITDNAGVSAGDTMRFQLIVDGEPTGDVFEFMIVGIEESSFANVGFDGAIYAPVESFPQGFAPTNTSVIVDIEDEFVPALRRELTSIPGTFVFDTAFITALLNSLIGTFTAFPTLVAILGLIVGGVVIANSVALTTMERRSEIAVMKAVGLQRERVLSMILVENGILGVIGGLVGVGIGLIALIQLVSAFGVPSSAVPIGTALLLMGLCVVVSLAAAITTAWGASGEKPLNVLRYE